MLLNKIHRNLEEIPCQQYTQTNDLVQKMNADYFALIRAFTLGDSQYFVEKFFSSIKAGVLHEIIKYMNKNEYRFLWTDRDERICLRFKKQIVAMNIDRSDTFLVKSCLNA